MTANLKLHIYAVTVAVATLLLIVAGALVTSNDAGLAAPDWPLAYGQVFPPMVGNLFYEHGHRLFAAATGALVVILTVWIQVSERRTPVKRLALAALVLVIVQGSLGGLTVLLQLPLAVSTAHACIAQLFFCSVVSLAVVTSPGWMRLKLPSQKHSWSESEPNIKAGSLNDTASSLKIDFETVNNSVKSVARWSVAAVAVIFMQLLLGAVLRHAATWDQTPPLALVLLHVMGAAAVIFVVGRLVWLLLRNPVWRALPNGATRLMVKLARIIDVLLCAQVLLGVLTYIARLYSPSAAQPQLHLVVVTVAHVAGGALVLGSTLILTLVATRLAAGDNSSEEFDGVVPNTIELVTDKVAGAVAGRQNEHNNQAPVGSVSVRRALRN